MENQRVTKQMARFVVMYDTPPDIEAFERHLDLRIPPRPSGRGGIRFPA
jgi:hypothetical protein